VQEGDPVAHGILQRAGRYLGLPWKHPGLISPQQSSWWRSAGQVICSLIVVNERAHVIPLKVQFVMAN
jgi:hypothetical protein